MLIAVVILVIRVCDDLVIAVVIAEIPVPADAEIRPASVVYPDTVVVSAPLRPSVQGD